MARAIVQSLAGYSVEIIPECGTMPSRPDNVSLLVEHIISEMRGALFHVTDERNLASIAKHGLLSKQEAETRGVTPVYPGGDGLAWSLDRQYGLWNDVFLAFHTSMVMPKQPDERWRRPRVLSVDSQVLHFRGAKIALGRANHDRTKTYSVGRAVDRMDHEAFLGKLDRDDIFVRHRIHRAFNYEVLIPTVVPPAYILEFR